MGRSPCSPQVSRVLSVHLKYVRFLNLVQRSKDLPPGEGLEGSYSRIEPNEGSEVLLKNAVAEFVDRILW